MRGGVLVALLMSAVCVTVFGAAPPRFEDYPVTDIFKGTPAAPTLSTAQARRFRTQLRMNAAQGPDFAGHFKLARWGCGAGCTFVAVIDSMTGEVYFPPVSFADATKDVGSSIQIVCHHASDYQIDSELFIIEGATSGGKVGTHYYRWHDRKMTLVHFEPECWSPVDNAKHRVAQGPL
jgi:hypothetical protein